MADDMRNLIDKVDPTLLRSLYEQDEHLWIAAQIAAIQERRFNDIDGGNLIQYLTEMTLRDHRELRSRIVILITHLLKITMQPTKMTKSWVSTIMREQDEIATFIQFVPSLKSIAEKMYVDAYPKAVRNASRETGIKEKSFPVTCLWSLEEALAFESPEPPLHPSKKRKE